MAVKLSIDTGVKEYEINGGEANGGGTLRFNPTDPNVYDRFVKSVDNIRHIEDELVKKGQEQKSGDAQADGKTGLDLLRQADLAVKEVLNEVFGAGNDFDAIFGGVNVMAVAANGERVITNFLSAIEPIVTQGAQGYAEGKAQTALANRARRRAVGKRK